MKEIQWTNPSVKKLAGKEDPIQTIIEKTRSIVLEAMDNGWQGPPFDPLILAKHLGFVIIPTGDILDARLIPSEENDQIEYNPNRARTRIKFSIAHEIAHTLFPDYKKGIHHRSRQHVGVDDWQLELLCNIAAGEILMPFGPETDLQNNPITMNMLVEIQKQYDVSMESVLLRMVKITNQPITIFAASRIKEEKESEYRVDYAIRSSTSNMDIKPGTRISSEKVLAECTGIGFTAKRREKLFDGCPEWDIECVGIPPYPNSIYPRVLGIVKTRTKSTLEPLSIKYLRGDATEPRGTGFKIIVHIANDESKKWGRGFGFAISKKWPVVRTEFVKWALSAKPKLGTSHKTQVSDNLLVFSMIAQHGYGKSSVPRIRYRHLRTCLEELFFIAQNNSASVHMPRIGTGFAGGDWNIISELIDQILVKRGIQVTVYDLPGREIHKVNQTILDFVEKVAMK